MGKFASCMLAFTPTVPTVRNANFILVFQRAAAKLVYFNPLISREEKQVVYRRFSFCQKTAKTSKTQPQSNMTTQNWDDLIDPMWTEFSTSTENEHNWQKRMKYCDSLAERLNKNKDVPRNFFDKGKMLIGPIVNTAASERTQLSGVACKLIGALYQSLGSQMHSSIEIIVPTLVQVCGSTKKINQTNGNNTMLTIIKFSGYNGRLLYHICNTFNDKRKDARAYAPIWLTTFLQTYEHALDAHKDYPTIEKALITGLNDGDVKAREATRATFWQYSKINQSATDAIIETLNNHAANALKSDKNNPHKAAPPSKAAKSGESTLAKIKAQSKKAAATDAYQAPPQLPPKQQAMRDVSKTSSLDLPFPHRHFSGMDEPTLIKPRKVPQALRQKLENEHDKLVELSIRDEDTPIYQLGEYRKRVVAPPQYPPLTEPISKKGTKQFSVDIVANKDAEMHQADSESSNNVRPFLSAPVRRPRVVATPMSQPQTTSRPTSKGEPIKQSESSHRSQTSKTGRQTPVIPEEKHSESRARPTTKSYKSSAQIEHKSSAALQSSRPTSSSSEPAGIKSPKGHIQQSASINALPTKHVKAPSAADIKLPSSLSSIATTSQLIDYSKLKTMSPLGIVERPLFGKKPSELNVAKYQHRVSPTKNKQNITPLSDIDMKSPSEGSWTSTPAPPRGHMPQPTGQENIQNTKSKPELEREALTKARRSLPSIIEALKEGKLDALGYRKLRKLILDYPGDLFVGIESDNQYDALYRALIAQLSSNQQDSRDPRANLNHPNYSRMAVVDMLHNLMLHYPYGEPTPGMTLVALLVAKATSTGMHPSAYHRINTSMAFFLSDICMRWNPLPVIDAVTDSLMELHQVIVAHQSDTTAATPTWQKLFELSTSPEFMNSPNLNENPAGAPARLINVMEQGVEVVADLIKNTNQCGLELYDVQLDGLARLVTACVTTYRQDFKKGIIRFATELYGAVGEEERFERLFDDEGDLNLVYYCVGRGIEEGAEGMSFEEEE